MGARKESGGKRARKDAGGELARRLRACREYQRRYLDTGPALGASAQPPEPAAAPPAPEVLGGRYEIEAEIGRGGMGRIVRAYDRQLDRRVAVKVLRGAGVSPERLDRLVEEARATARLEHPNIAPIYDVGVDPEGAPFFVMRMVRGRTLKEILRDIALGRPEVCRHYSIVRLAQILQQVARGAHFAHAKGVIHRDIKPGNIMVGDFGEVLLMDFGIAKFLPRSEDPSPADPRAAAIEGSPQYMAPEQARGESDRIGPPADVFGLGACLYEILTHAPPYDDPDPERALACARAARFLPPRERAPRNAIPGALEEICRKAMAAEPAERFGDAWAFHEELQVFLDGTREEERRREEAAALLAEGDRRAASYRSLREDAGGAREMARALLLRLRGYEPIGEKAPGWREEDRARDLERAAAEAFQSAAAAYEGVLAIVPGHAEAESKLADLFYERFVEAERVRDRDAALYFRGLVERHDRGRYGARLRGDGEIAVDSRPGSAVVILHRYEERGRRLVLGEGRAVGRTPLRSTIPMGSYLVVLSRPGFRAARVPVLIERCGRYEGTIALYRDEEIGDGFIYVPAGAFICGGDPDAHESLEAERPFAGDFFIGRFSVTFREYCGFLDDLAARRGSDLPRRIPSCGDEVYVLEEGGAFRPSPTLIEGPARDRYPAGFEMECPVMGVDWESAKAYCAWRSARDGRAIRLLREREWEKAARGVDGRAYPWGDGFDWAFVKGASSRPEFPQPEPVGAFPIDESPYGVRDMAGSIRDWCEDWYQEGRSRVCRGGSWSFRDPRSFRCADRIGPPVRSRGPNVGFRIAAEPPPPDEGN
ncbi:MAG: SUMF1/EgtB/PvdO family nonheme iron enzyme [Planctomycetes bacterium]|nr:SUMF1/EgtB/PvdO family nonheme iron enzyme [Planctomycetota bacterium]